MALDFTAAGAMLKEYYTHEMVETLVLKDSAFFGLVPKNPDASGADYVVPLIYGNPAGRSANIANAIANAQASRMARFTVSWASDYGYATLDNKTIKAMRNDEGAFLRAIKTEVDGMLNRMKRSAQTTLFRDGNGAIGQVGSGQASNTITLLLLSDAYNFESNDVLVAGPNNSSVALRVGTGTVNSINRSAGTLTTNGAVWSTQITSLAANDYLFIQGDPSAKMAGLSGWLPFGGPTATPWFGLDRTQDTERLGGISYTATGLSLEESLLELSGRVNDNGGTVSHIFVHPKQYRALVKQLGSKVNYAVQEGGLKAKIGFKGISIDTDKGPVGVFGDINCPNNRAFALQLDTWELPSLGPVPSLFDTDDQELLRVTQSDSVEVRGIYYGNLACAAPGWNGVASLDTVV